MEWLILVMLVVIGIVLLLLEFLVFPGVNVVGVIGFLCVCFAVYLGYRFFGTPAGHFVLLGVAVASGALTWYALQAKTWRRLSLNSQIDSTVEGVDESVKAGDTGVAVGRLAPMGKVRVGEVVVEGQSVSGYVDPDQEVEVVKVFKDKIIVKLKTSEHG